MMIDANYDNFDESVSKGIVLAEFYAPWCGFCRKQESILKELENITIVGVNGDDYPNLTKRFGITGYPSFVVFKEGKPVQKFSGLHTKQELMKILTDFFFK